MFVCGWGKSGIGGIEKSGLDWGGDITKKKVTEYRMNQRVTTREGKIL